MVHTPRIRAGLLALLAVVCLAAGGCSSTYWMNRLSDSAQIVEFNLGVGLYGEGLYVPHVLLSAQATRAAHLAIGNAAVYRIGVYGGYWNTWSESASALPMAPFFYDSSRKEAPENDPDQRWDLDLYDRWDWFLGIPSYYRDVWDPTLKDAEIGVTMESPIHFFDLAVDIVALIPAARLGISPGELLDFITGWFGLDLANDDELPPSKIGGHLKRIADRAARGNSDDRRLALLTVLRYQDHPEAWDVLRSACEWENVADRGLALHFIERGRWSDYDRLPIMIRLLDDPDGRIRLRAIAAIHTMKAKVSAAAIPALAAVLDHPTDSRERALACAVLADLAARGSEADRIAATRAFARHLADESPFVRTTCLNALRNVGRASAAQAIPELVAVLGLQEHTEDKIAAVLLLAWIGPPAQAALPALEDLLQHPNQRLRDKAAFAIERITKLPE